MSFKKRGKSPVIGTPLEFEQVKKQVNPEPDCTCEKTGVDNCPKHMVTKH
jgi:hypothetical protein